LLNPRSIQRPLALGCALSSLLVARYFFSEYVRGGPLPAIRSKE